MLENRQLKQRDIKLTKQSMLFETNVVLSGGPIFIFLLVQLFKKNAPICSIYNCDS